MVKWFIRTRRIPLDISRSKICIKAPRRSARTPLWAGKALSLASRKWPSSRDSGTTCAAWRRWRRSLGCRCAWSSRPGADSWAGPWDRRWSETGSAGGPTRSSRRSGSAVRRRMADNQLFIMLFYFSFYHLYYIRSIFSLITLFPIGILCFFNKLIPRSLKI